jgi:hypothetical protein
MRRVEHRHERLDWVPVHLVPDADRTGVDLPEPDERLVRRAGNPADAVWPTAVPV